MKDQLSTLIVSAWNNKHTSTAAVILFVCSTVGILWPAWKDKMDEISKAALFYGLLRAGDASATPKP